MSMQEIAAAVLRVESAFRRRPEVGIHGDAPALARWESGTRVVCNHAAGMQVVTDMPKELGGSGDQLTPGWLFRAGLASCAATSITLKAAAKGIALTALQVQVDSKSDARGLLGMSEPAGDPVFAGPFDVELHVRIAASDTTPEDLRAMVESCLRPSPVPSALTHAIPYALYIDVGRD